MAPNTQTRVSGKSGGSVPHRVVKGFTLLHGHTSLKRSNLNNIESSIQNLGVKHMIRASRRRDKINIKRGERIAFTRDRVGSPRASPLLILGSRRGRAGVRRRSSERIQNPENWFPCTL